MDSDLYVVATSTDLEHGVFTIRLPSRLEFGAPDVVECAVISCFITKPLNPPMVGQSIRFFNTDKSEWELIKIKDGTYSKVTDILMQLPSDYIQYERGQLQEDEPFLLAVQKGTVFSFSSKLQEQMGLPKNQEIRADVICHYMPYTCLFIEAKNLVGTTMVNGAHRPVLAMIPAFGGSSFQLAGPSLYKSVKAAAISSITLEIKSADGERLSFQNGRALLHIRFKSRAI